MLHQMDKRSVLTLRKNSEAKRLVLKSAGIIGEGPIILKANPSQQRFPFEVFCAKSRIQRPHNMSRQASYRKPISFILPPRPESVLSDMRKLRGDCVEIMKNGELCKKPDVLPQLLPRTASENAISFRRHNRINLAVNEEVMKRYETAGNTNQISNLRRQASRPLPKKTYLHRIHDFISHTIDYDTRLDPCPPQNEKPSIEIFKTVRRKKHKIEQTKGFENKENVFASRMVSRNYPRPVFVRRKLVPADKANKGMFKVKKEVKASPSNMFNLTFGESNNGIKHCL